MQALDNFAYVISVDYILHEPTKPFCFDETCGCHEDQELVAEVVQFVQDGTMTLSEAADFVAGKTI